MHDLRSLRPQTGRTRGQAMVELALVLPLVLTVLFGIITFGIGIFYQQEITNAAREAARYASLHSATSSKPTVGWLDPNSQDPPGSGITGVNATYTPLSYTRFDRPEDGWPFMTAQARSLLFGIDSPAVNIAACWSGYRDDTTNAFDAPPPGDYVIAGSPVHYDTHWATCTIDGHDPSTEPGAIGCNGTLASTTVDQASDMSEGRGAIVANQVTAYACYEWHPPLAGFLLVPSTITLRAVISEPIERQQ